MKVLISIHIPQIGIDMLKAHSALEVTLWDKELPMEREELISHAREHEILLSASIYKIDKSFLESCPNLKMISQFSAGYDNVDLAAIHQKKIPFANAPGAMNDATADVAFGLMMAVSRKMFFQHQKIINGNWTHFNPRAYLGLEQKGKNLGIFGLGKIGFEMAKRCVGAYDMKVYYHNRTRSRVAEEELNAQYVSFEELLEISDVISVHSALNSDTAEIFNWDAFKKMKPTSIFINAARGGIHNEEDLIKALREKVIWGTGLDVTHPEPMKKDNPLLFMENACVLPHIGSATINARDEMARLSAMNILQFVNQEKITHLVS